MGQGHVGILADLFTRLEPVRKLMLHAIKNLSTSSGHLATASGPSCIPGCNSNAMTGSFRHCDGLA